MQDWQQRAVKEKQELSERLSKLDNFIKGKDFLSLPPDQCDLLHRQQKVMTEYLNILMERVERFESDDKK